MAVTTLGRNICSRDFIADRIKSDIASGVMTDQIRSIITRFWYISSSRAEEILFLAFHASRDTTIQQN